MISVCPILSIRESFKLLFLYCSLPIFSHFCVLVLWRTIVLNLLFSLYIIRLDFVYTRIFVVHNLELSQLANISCIFTILIIKKLITEIVDQSGNLSSINSLRECLAFSAFGLILICIKYNRHHINVWYNTINLKV